MFSSFIYTLSLHDALPILPSSIHPEALGRRQKHSRGMMVDGERRLSSSEFLRSAAFLGRKTGTIACTAVRSAGPRKVLFAHGFWEGSGRCQLTLFWLHSTVKTAKLCLCV